MRRIGAVAIVLLALGAGAALVMARAVLHDTRWIATTRSAVEDATGLRVQFGSAPVVRLFPRPRLVVNDLTMAGTGAFAVHATAAEATVALLPLMHGRVVLDRLRLDDVTGTVDADAIVRAYRAPLDAAPGAAAGEVGGLPQRIIVTSGFLRVQSSAGGASGFLSEIHAVADGIRAGAATLSGGATWHGEKVELSARFDSLARLLGSGPATGTVRIKAPSLSGSVAGTWAKGWRGGFAGNVMAGAPDFPNLLRIAGLVPGPLAGVRNVSFVATAEPSANGLAFSAARVAVNGNEFEGSLGVEMADRHPVVVGTLATERLDLDPILAALPALHDKAGGWSTESAPLVLGDFQDMDLRISANTISFDGFVAEDAALSVLSHDRRVELSLGEARAYGGLLKARLMGSAAVEGVVVKLEASWSQLDLAGLGAAAGWQDGRLAGTSSGHATLEGEGSSIAGLVRSLDGKGQINLLQVEAKTPTVGALLHPDDAGSAAPAAVAFDLATLDFRVANGTLELGKGTVSGPNLHLDVTGRASLLDRSYALSTQPSGDVEAGTPAVPPLRLAGIWGGPVHWLAPGARDDTRPDAGQGDRRLMP